MASKLFWVDVSRPSAARRAARPTGLPQGAYKEDFLDFLGVAKTKSNFSETDKVGARSLEQIPSFICTSQKIVPQTSLETSPGSFQGIWP